ncbi:MAG: ketoacyl-ACP synthase III [Syntrophales bacterium]|nr:ketoacyl-ACP synthase III [Syntrophales bacterium]
MLYLHGLGHFAPENLITNKFLEDLDIGTTDEWILERVGIRTRHTVLPLDYIKTTKNRDMRAALEVRLYNHAQIGAAAARMALEQAGIRKEDIGLLISGSSVPDNLSPAEAPTVAAELGIEVPCFDISSACSTFGMQINVLNKMKPEALPPFILMVVPETSTLCMDYSDRNSAVLFGDAAAAVVVSATVPSRAAFIASDIGTKPSSWEKVNVPRLGYFRQDGAAVQKFAIRKTTELLRKIMPSFPVKADRLKFIGHQANMGMLRTVCELTGIEEHNHWRNVVDFGNTAAAGAPGVLSQHWHELQPGDYVAIIVVGAGLSWSSLMLKMEEETG